MKIFHRLISISLFLFVIVINGYSQNGQSIFLKEKIYPIYSWNKSMNALIDSMNKVNHSTFAYLAGDYTDGNTRFSLALDDGQNGQTAHKLYVTFYKSDSVYVGGGIGINQAPILNNVPIIIKVGDKEFSAKVNADNNSVFITPLTNHVNPDIELVNNNLPDITFPLLYGGESSFRQYEHKSNYIYIEFWRTLCGHCYEAMDDLKKIHNTYSDKLTMISIAFDEPANPKQDIDTNDIKKVVEVYHLNWTQGVANTYIRRLFYLNSAPYGILYKSDGTLVKSAISPKELLKFFK
jgi:thiol-disulfide isomerase/thioredoxin